MLEKTVNKIIRKKMNDWVSQMPPEIQEEVKANAIVSGGCIASLFLQEDVNDFDVYFATTEGLVKYLEYENKRLPKDMPSITFLNGQDREQHLHNNIMERYAYIDPEEYLLNEQYSIHGEGGDNSYEFIRISNLKPDQIQMQVPPAGQKYEYDEPPELNAEEYRPVFISPNSVTLTGDVQVVTRFTGSPEEIHKNYDFVHATNYWTFKDGLVTNLPAMTCLITKELRYQGSRYPLTSILRMKKFVRRGWKINAGEVLKIMFQISELDLRDPFVLEEQLIGVDVAYFSHLVQMIFSWSKSKDDQQRLEQSLFFNMIDTVFNNLYVDDPEEETNL